MQIEYIYIFIITKVDKKNLSKETFNYEEKKLHETKQSTNTLPTSLLVIYQNSSNSNMIGQH